MVNTIGMSSIGAGRLDLQKMGQVKTNFLAAIDNLESLGDYDVTKAEADGPTAYVLTVSDLTGKGIRTLINLVQQGYAGQFNTFTIAKNADGTYKVKLGSTNEMNWKNAVVSEDTKTLLSGIKLKEWGDAQVSGKAFVQIVNGNYEYVIKTVGPDGKSVTFSKGIEMPDEVLKDPAKISSFMPSEEQLGVICSELAKQLLAVYPQLDRKDASPFYLIIGEGAIVDPTAESK